MPPSKYSQYPVVGRISANGIKNIIIKALFEILSVPHGRSYFFEWY